MATVFISGSRELPYLSEEIYMRIGGIIDSGYSIVVGDSERGVDAAVLLYLKKCGYPNVSIYTIHTNSRARSILDTWTVHTIKPRAEVLRDRTGKIRNGRELETAKDMAMCSVADYGLVIWQSNYTNRFMRASASKGSLRNMYQLLAEGKPVVLYKAHASVEGSILDFDCLNLKSVDNLKMIVGGDPDVVGKAYKEIENKYQKSNSGLLSLFDSE